jgi:hypothetical protein
MTHDETNEVLEAIRAELTRPLSREQIVCNELWTWLFDADLSTWTDEDWLKLSRHLIQTVETARDISAEEAAAAMEAPWLGPPLPEFDDL